MKKVALLFMFLLFINAILHAQIELPPVSLNHIYIVLDSVTYNHLFDSAFIDQKIGDVKSRSVTTATDSWSGKYLYGKNSYIEFFSDQSYEGAVVGDCGLGFITLTSGDIWKIKKHWEPGTADAVLADTIISMESDGKDQPWYYAIYLPSNDSVEHFATWIMENTFEELQSAGFTQEEIKNEITWQQYAERRSKKAFTKCFSHIRAIYLTLPESGYVNIEKSFTGFGLQHHEGTYFNNNFKVICSRGSNPYPTLKMIEVELTEPLEKAMIKVSDNLSLEIEGKTAMWIFQ